MPMYEPSIMAAGLLDLAKKSMVRRHPVSLPPRWGNERPVQGRTTVNATHSFRSTVPCAVDSISHAKNASRNSRFIIRNKSNMSEPMVTGSQTAQMGDPGSKLGIIKSGSSDEGTIRALNRS